MNTPAFSTQTEAGDPGIRQRIGGSSRRASSFAIFAGALCLGGLAVLALELWLAPADFSSNLFWKSDRGPQFWMLQPLIGGSLAILLFWVWLDCLWATDKPGPEAARFNLWFVAVAVVITSRLLFLGIVGVLNEPLILPLTILFAVPTVTLVTVALWLTAGRIASLWLRTVVLAGLGVAGWLTQESFALTSDREPGMDVYLRNSCLIGFALLVWLVASAAAPGIRRSK